MKNCGRVIVMTAVLLIGIALWMPGLRSRRVAAQSAGLTGSYGFTLIQTWDGGDLPGALLGVLTFDGAGKFTGSVTQAVVVPDPKATTPQVQAGQQFSGTYTVNADGTGIATQQDGTTVSFVTTDGGSGLMLLPTAGFGNHLLTGTARKQ
jgi:hypothetical protein